MNLRIRKILIFLFLTFYFSSSSNSSAGPALQETLASEESIRSAYLAIQDSDLEKANFHWLEAKMTVHTNRFRLDVLKYLIHSLSTNSTTQMPSQNLHTYLEATEAHALLGLMYDAANDHEKASHYYRLAAISEGPKKPWLNTYLHRAHPERRIEPIAANVESPTSSPRNNASNLRSIHRSEMVFRLAEEAGNIIMERSRTCGDLQCDSPIFTAPIIQQVTTTSAMIQASAAASCRQSIPILIGTSVASLQRDLMLHQTGSIYRIELTHLLPETKYFYKIPNSTLSNTFHFYTAPAERPSMPTRIWCLGDSGVQARLPNISPSIYSPAASAFNGPQIVLLLGDNAYESGLYTEYANGIFTTFQHLFPLATLLTTEGDHDTRCNPVSEPRDTLFLPKKAYYSYDWANIHFVIFSKTNGINFLTWLTNDLHHAGEKSDWIIAASHYPMFNNGRHSNQETESALENKEIFPILQHGGVDLFVSGNEHVYTRTHLLKSTHTFSSNCSNECKFALQESDRNTYEKGNKNGAIYCIAGNSRKVETDNTYTNKFLEQATLINEVGSFTIIIDGNKLEGSFTPEKTNGRIGHFFIEK